MNNERYLSLDGLRAYAAIGILIMHVRANISVKPADGFLYGNFIPSLTNFVYLFLMISAFAVCCGYYDKFKTGAISPNKFYKKRYSRILPFFTVLVLINTFVPHSPNEWTMKHMMAEGITQETGITAFIHSIYDGFAQLTLAFNLLPNPRPTIGVAWFLGVIFLFYMIFPFFVFMMDNKRRAWISLAICFIFAFMAVDYFLTDRFINWGMTRHCIVYDAPFLAVGGLIFLYKENIKLFVQHYRWPFLFFCIALTCIYWFVPSTRKGFPFLVVMTAICASWLSYAIGSSGIILNNRIVRYLSGISMEIYLCHMVCHRAVRILHVENLIDSIYVTYWIECILTLLIAICFSHVVKYLFLPKLEYLYKKIK